MGQRAANVLIYYLVGGGGDSPDAIMFRALAKKADAVSRVVNGGEATSSMRDSLTLTPKRRRRVPENEDGTPVAKGKRRRASELSDVLKDV